MTDLLTYSVKNVRNTLNCIALNYTWQTDLITL